MYEYSIWLEELYICSIHANKYMSLMCNIWNVGMNIYTHAHMREYTHVFMYAVVNLFLCVWLSMQHTLLQGLKIYGKGRDVYTSTFGDREGCVLTE